MGVVINAESNDRRDVERPQVAINCSCHLSIIFVNRKSHGRSRNTANRYVPNITKKYKEKNTHTTTWHWPGACSLYYYLYIKVRSGDV